MLQILPGMLKVFIYPLPSFEFYLGQNVLHNPKNDKEQTLSGSSWNTPVLWLFIFTWTQWHCADTAHFVSNRMLRWCKMTAYWFLLITPSLRSQIVMAGRLGQGSFKTVALVDCPGVQCSLLLKSGPRREQKGACFGVTDGQDSLMHVWSISTDSSKRK